MHLIAEFLDKQLRDGRNENAGRVDGIVLELRANAPPRVAYLEVSPITLLGRFSERLARWYARYDAKLGPARGTPYRIPFERATRNGAIIRVPLDVRNTPIPALESWLSRTIVQRIPGG